MSNTIFNTKDECKTCLVAIAVIQKMRIDVDSTDSICPQRCGKRTPKVVEADLFNYKNKVEIGGAGIINT